MMAYLKAVVITGLIVAGFLAISSLIFLLWPLLMRATVFGIVLSVIKNNPPSYLLGGVHI